MGMSNKELYILIAGMVFIIAYSGVVFYVAEKVGQIWAVVSLNILNVTFFMFAVHNMEKSKESK